MGKTRHIMPVPIATTDLFYTNNGVPIEEDKNWDYAGRNQLRTGDAANFYFIKQGYTTIKAHFDRESTVLRQALVLMAVYGMAMASWMPIKHMLWNGQGAGSGFGTKICAENKYYRLLA
jgi:hypothetical protein